MELSALAQKVYKFYKVFHLYTAQQVQDFADKGKITQAEADYIIGE